MMKVIIDKFNSMEEKTKKILKYGIYFSSFVCAIYFTYISFSYNS